MWVCPNCGKEFKSDNQTHSCSAIPVEQHFEKRMDFLEIYQEILNSLNAFGNYKIYSIKNAIRFKTQSTFLSVSVKKDFLELEFYSDHELENPRIDKRLKTSKNRNVHSVKIIRKEDIDPILIDWIRYSYNLIGRPS